MKIEERRKFNETLALEIYEKISKTPKQAIHIANILTKGEKISIGRRLLIAQAIINGTTRRELEDTLGISPNTFAQVNRWLADEFKEYSPFTAARKTTRPDSYKHIDPFTLKGLKKTYPGYFLLFSIAEEILQRYKK
jgi:uncharacterized protein YerC